MSRKKICIVATVPFAIRVHMAPHIQQMSKKYDVTIVTNGSSDELAELLNSHVFFKGLKIERKISIKADILAIVRLWWIFKKNSFDCVHSIMPKSGMLSMIAARFSGVALRIHTFTGQIWATQTGLRRFILKLFDKILAINATHLLTDSQSQRLFLVKNGVVRADKIRVLADGSIVGVDTNRFSFDPIAYRQIRSEKDIPDSAVLFMFLGRLTRDKGLGDLFGAFARIATNNTKVQLLIVGPDEGGLTEELKLLVQRFPGRVHSVGYTDSPEQYMSAADVFCLPSYREGFGSVLIESAAVGLPSIASRIYGITDAVDEGVTGLLHQPGLEDEIVNAMSTLAFDEVLRRKMGVAAQKRAREQFSDERVKKAFSDYYHELFSTYVQELK